ncbi:MAG: peptidoglycan DD-metalloendopeptidase family protein [Actinomycetota bacterium]|nr:peptidoglycan DD-metalloendopeptidase family protein [Actinomycetota bacterium]
MRRTLRKALALVIAVGIVALTPATALADVTRAELDAAQEKVREVSRRLEGRLTELDQSIGMQASYEERIHAIEQKLLDRQRELVIMELQAKERASAMYMNAGGSSQDSLFNVQDISQVGARSAYLDSLSGQQRDVVNDLLFLQNDSKRLEAELERLVAEQADETLRLQDSSAEIYAELEIANNEYQVVYQQWEKQEAERRAREEAERQRAAAAASAAAAAASNHSSSGHVSPAGRTCPVAGANSFRDSWLEPRSGGRQHHGVDMIAAMGTPLVAAESGYIWSMSSHYLGGLGIYVRGNSGDIYYYAHLSAFASGLQQGLRVDRGQLIGYVGDTGNATGTPHLHLGYQPGGGPLTNPYQLMVKLCR